MIDFWEILGHAAVNDGFRNNLYAAFAKSKAAPDDDNAYACMFADADYDAARKLVVAEIGHPISLMALGEWLVVSIVHPDSRPTLDTVAARVQGMLKGYNSTDPVFYQTLGASIVDAGFQDEFNQGKEPNYGFNLSQADRAALVPVIADGTFQHQAGGFKAIPWDAACKDMVIQSLGEPYAHALEDKFQS
jgi:hypothetical protein